MREITNDEGVVETVYTAEEYKAMEEKATGYEANIKEKDSALAEKERLLAEKSENIRRFSNMTEEEKKNFDANTTNILRHADKLETELNEVKTKLTEKEQREKDFSKNSSLEKVHMGDEATKKRLEDNYAVLAGMPETTPQEINARVNAAARMAGITIDPRNPIYTPMNGEAPPVPKTADNYVESEAGKVAADMARGALGIKSDNK